jgi:malate dehydrogenase (oxaloacetate-decarboxylating)(NADP+)
VERLKFGPEYLIPTPFDPRVLLWEAVAVAKAAMDSGVAQEPVNLEAYREQLERRLGKAHEVAHLMVHKAQAQPKQVVFPEGDNEKILRACHTLVEENIAVPILLGNASTIRSNIAELGLELCGVRIVDPTDSPLRERYIQDLFRLRQRRGMTLAEAHQQIDNRNIFGSMMLRMGDADALVSGLTQHFPDTLRPALEIVRVREGLHKVAGCYAMITRKGDVYFLADTSVNVRTHSRGSGGNRALHGADCPAF